MGNEGVHPLIFNSVPDGWGGGRVSFDSRELFHPPKLVALSLYQLSYTWADYLIPGLIFL